MADHRRRVRTLQALVAGEPDLSAAPIHPDIQRELNEIYRCRRLRQQDRRRLLQLIHGCRAIDSSLLTLLDARYPGHGEHSLGRYLGVLRNRGVLTNAQRLHYRTQIVDNRNTVMHTAGHYPQADNDVAAILGEMEALLAQVL